jgi:radical SAM superfamily enzyme YgiQ (UPF0313 family)
MDILLIQPPVHDFYLTQKRTIPYGLACLASALKFCGFDTEIFDALSTNKSKKLSWPENMSYLKQYYGRSDISPFALFHQYRHFGYSFQHIGQIARQSNAFLVGISSLFTAYSEQALITAQIIKKYHPKCLIVMGGHHPTHFPKTVLVHPDIDFVIRGEGEQSLPMLAKAIRNEMGIKDIPGIAFKLSENDFFIRSPAILKDLNVFSLPDMSSIKQRFYRRNKQKGLVITASRGCPMKCSYCTMGDQRWPYRKKTVSRVIEEISEGIGTESSAFIDFEDENISLDQRYFLSLLEQIQQNFPNRHLELRAMNGLYPASLDRTIVVRMKEAGFNALNLSVGTFSQKQLKRFQRPDVSEKLKDIIMIAKQINLATTTYIIAGAPYQDPFETVDDILKLVKMGTVVGLSIFYPAPGSQDFALLEKEQKLPKDVNLMRGSTIPISHTTTRTQAITLLRLTRIVNFVQDLINHELKIPSPVQCTEDKLLTHEGRLEIGKKLLSFFLYDGKIRGVDKNGLIYQHVVDSDVIDYFRRSYQMQ